MADDPMDFDFLPMFSSAPGESAEDDPGNDGLGDGDADNDADDDRKSPIFSATPIS